MELTKNCTLCNCSYIDGKKVDVGGGCEQVASGVVRQVQDGGGHDQVDHHARLACTRLYSTSLSMSECGAT